MRRSMGLESSFLVLNKMEKGFSLLETLLALSITLSLLLLPSAYVSKHVDHIQEELFFKRFQSHYEMAQNHAILTGDNVRIFFNKGNRNINFEYTANPNHFIGERLYYPDSISQKTDTYTFRILGHTGSLSSFKTTRYQVGDENVEIAFQMGKGKYILRRDQ